MVTADTVTALLILAASALGLLGYAHLDRYWQRKDQEKIEAELAELKKRHE